MDSEKLNENDTKMSEKMIELWTSFAINGIPTMSGVQWPSFNGEKMFQTILVQSENLRIHSASFFRLNRTIPAYQH